MNATFTFYQQPDTMDCGPTCLRMVAKHYKRYITLQSLREKTQIGKEGVNLLGICDAAEAIGFRVQAIKVGFNALVTQAQLPAILHWNQNHFVVLYKVKGSKLLIADPARGLITYTPDEFKKHWISVKANGQEEVIALLL